VREPDVGKFHAQRRMWTVDQKLVAIARYWDGALVDEYFADASPEVVEYALAQVAGLRRELLKLRRDRSVTCRSCGEAFAPARSTAVYCSTRCRVAAHRQSAG
jgi:hypothetical protein